MMMMREVIKQNKLPFTIGIRIHTFSPCEKNTEKFKEIVTNTTLVLIKATTILITGRNIARNPYVPAYQRRCTANRFKEQKSLHYVIAVL